MNTINPLSLRTVVRSTDVETVQRLVVSTGVFAPYEVDIAIELVEEHLLKGEKSGYYFVFADRGSLTVGYTCYGPIACTEHRYDLYWIAVDKALHGQGIGGVLMRGTEERIAAMQGEKVYVETSSRTDYAPTRAFYLKQGYRIAAEIADFYKKGDNKVILVKDVNP